MRSLAKDEIEEQSPEWSNVAYRLQTMTGKSALKIIKLFRYAHARQARSDNKERVDSLVDVTDYKQEYKSKIVQQAIPLEDVIFFCGHVNIKKYHQEPNKIFTFLLCRTSLGRIGKFKDPLDKVDSVFIPPENEAEPYHFNFLLNSHSQYEVKYEVSFVIGDDLEIRNKEVVCSICESSIATIYCKDEKMHFCDSCCDDHHNEIKLAHESEYRKRVTPPGSKKSLLQAIPTIPPHQLERENRVNTLPLCESHSIKYEYFCLSCERYLCSICIQKGAHNQNAEHVIKHIEYLYQEKEEANNTISNRLKQKLESLLQDIEEVSGLITNNYESTRKKLAAEFERALGQLEDHYFSKISKVNSDEVELNMIYQKLEWSKAFIKHQEKYLKPIHYFKLQARYQHEIESIKISGYEQSFTMKPDLDYFIDWRVGTRDDERIEEARRMRERGSALQDSQLPISAHPKDSAERSIFKFHSRSEAPKRGDLCFTLEKSNLHFFKWKSLNSQTTRD